jgi:hypothetical protein
MTDTQLSRLKRIPVFGTLDAVAQV